MENFSSLREIWETFVKKMQKDFEKIQVYSKEIAKFEATFEKKKNWEIKNLGNVWVKNLEIKTHLKEIEKFEATFEETSEKCEKFEIC